MKSIVWFREDLRLHDNPALAAAAKDSHQIILLYILDETCPRSLGGAQRWWLHHSLSSLQKALGMHDSQLVLKRGAAHEILLSLVASEKIDAVYWNLSFDPARHQSDQILTNLLQTQGVTCHTPNGNYLSNLPTIKNKSGAPFKVFTPYYRTLTASLAVKPLIPFTKIRTGISLAGDSVTSWQLLPHSPDWSEGFLCWQPGEQGAQSALTKFIDNHLGNYATLRDRPDLLSTSKLSAHLHFGEISIWQIWHAVKQAALHDSRLAKGSEAFLRQLVWREFSYYLLHHFDNFATENFRQEFNQFPWKNNQQHLTAWQKGLTGYPIVDAGMRQLWKTGYMHNRVRMIAASFLTKDLLIDWRQGEAWFWDTLVDADIANNAAGWQWVAGSGADAAPYFRIFNPTLQSEKFDPNGDYIKQWIPELAALPKHFIHKPCEASPIELAAAGITLGKDYPYPIIDHSEARHHALEAYQEIKK